MRRDEPECDSALTLPPTAVKAEWGLGVSDRERAAMPGVLEVCPEGS